MSNIDGQLLKLIKKMTLTLEVKDRKPYEWKKAIQSGCKNWKMLMKKKGGVIEGDLHNRTIAYKSPPKRQL